MPNEKIDRRKERGGGRAWLSSGDGGGILRRPSVYLITTAYCSYLAALVVEVEN